MTVRGGRHLGTIPGPRSTTVKAWMGFRTLSGLYGCPLRPSITLRWHRIRVAVLLCSGGAASCGLQLLHMCIFLIRHVGR